MVDILTPLEDVPFNLADAEARKFGFVDMFVVAAHAGCFLHGLEDLARKADGIDRLAVGVELPRPIARQPEAELRTPG